VADKDTATNVRDGYASMKARQVVESEQWEKLALPTGAVKDGGAPGYDGSAAYVFAAGVSAANLGDLATANVALEKLKAMRTQAESGRTRIERGRSRSWRRKSARHRVQPEGRRDRRAADQGSDRHRDRPRCAVGSGRSDQAVVRAVWQPAAALEPSGRSGGAVPAVAEPHAEPPRRAEGSRARDGAATVDGGTAVDDRGLGLGASCQKDFQERRMT
jgi:hypothetical protein